MVVQHQLIENFYSGVHTKRPYLDFLVDRLLIRLKIAGFNEKLLKLKQIELNVLVLLQESMLVVCFLEFLILRAYTSDCSFHLLLHILYLICRFYQL